MNHVKSVLALALAAAVPAGLGYWFAGIAGLAVLLAAAVTALAAVVVFAERLVLWPFAVLPVRESDAPMLYDMVRKLARRFGLPMPRLYTVNENQPNAFVVGFSPKRAAIAVTTGLMKTLRPHEIAAVVGHELARIKNGDVLPMTVAAAVGAAIMWPATALAGLGAERAPRGVTTALVWLLAPLAAPVIRIGACSPQAFRADARAAKLSGQPLRLAAALRKMRRAAETLANHGAETCPAVAHLFIVNPLKAHGPARLIAPRTDVRARLRRLEKMALKHFDEEVAGRRALAA